MKAFVCYLLLYQPFDLRWLHFLISFFKTIFNGRGVIQGLQMHPANWRHWRSSWVEGARSTVAYGTAATPTPVKIGRGYCTVSRLLYKVYIILRIVYDTSLKLISVRLSTCTLSCHVPRVRRFPCGYDSTGGRSTVVGVVFVRRPD